jgi:hypothetical protein
MWNAAIESLQDGCVQRVHIRDGDGVLPYAAVLEGWQSDAGFRAFFNQLLADAPFTACFWETPPVTSASLDQAFECVIVDSPALAGVTAAPAAFAAYFDSARNRVTDFPNLGRDAWLVVPCPQGPEPVYAHLAAFARSGPVTQQQALWQRVGECVTSRLSDRPLWVSTSGLGVYWLHVRLDSFPKYYTWRPYRQA